MSDIQRWDFISFDPTFGPHMRKAHGGTMAEWVAYADHVAAVAAARAEGENHAARVLSASNYKQGVKDGVKAARDAVDSVVDEVGWRTVARSAIDALLEDR